MIERTTSEPVVEKKRNIKSSINSTKEIKREKQKRQKEGKNVEISPHILLTTINVNRLNLQLKVRDSRLDLKYESI